MCILLSGTGIRGVSTELKMKELKMDVQGDIDVSNLDELEIFLLHRFTKDVKGIALLRLAVKLVSEALNIEVVNGSVLKPLYSANLPFNWYDLRFGSGAYALTQEPVNGKTIHFVRREGTLDQTDRDRRAEAAELAARGTTRHYGPMAEYYTIPEGGWPEPYKFEIALGTNLPEIHRDLIKEFLPECSGGTRFNAYFQMNIKSCGELCRRLGYRPVFDDYFS